MAGFLQQAIVRTSTTFSFSFVTATQAAPLEEACEKTALF
jgi:hypothetical protein